MDEKQMGELRDALRASIKAWLEANFPAQLQEDQVEALMLRVVGALVEVAAGFSQTMPGPVRLNGHQFRKMAEAAFKEAARAEVGRGGRGSVPHS